MVNEHVPDDWDPEDDAEDIDADSITPEIPPEMYKTFVWRSIRAAMDIVLDRDEVIRMVKKWNLKNNPKLSEPQLVNMVIWAFKHWLIDIDTA